LTSKSAEITDFSARESGGSELHISTKLNHLTNVFSFAADQFFFWLGLKRCSR
jgi:hypothetical protein